MLIDTFNTPHYNGIGDALEAGVKMNSTLSQLHGLNEQNKARELANKKSQMLLQYVNPEAAKHLAILSNQAHYAPALSQGTINHLQASSALENAQANYKNQLAPGAAAGQAATTAINQFKAKNPGATLLGGPGKNAAGEAYIRTLGNPASNEALDTIEYQNAQKAGANHLRGSPMNEEADQMARAKSIGMDQSSFLGHQKSGMSDRDILASKQLADKSATGEYKVRAPNGQMQTFYKGVSPILNLAPNHAETTATQTKQQIQAGSSAKVESMGNNIDRLYTYEGPVNMSRTSQAYLDAVSGDPVRQNHAAQYLAKQGLALEYAGARAKLSGLNSTQQMIQIIAKGATGTINADIARYPRAVQVATQKIINHVLQTANRAELLEFASKNPGMAAESKPVPTPNSGNANSAKNVTAEINSDSYAHPGTQEYSKSEVAAEIKRRGI